MVYTVYHIIYIVIIFLRPTRRYWRYYSISVNIWYNIPLFTVRTFTAKKLYIIIYTVLLLLLYARNIYLRNFMLPRALAIVL
jgi:hypothetical protein